MGTSWTRRWLQRPEDEVRNSRRRAGAAREVLDRNSSSIRERPVARGTAPKRSSLEEVRVSLTQGPRCNAFALRRSCDDEGKKSTGVMAHAKKVRKLRPSQRNQRLRSEKKRTLKNRDKSGIVPIQNTYARKTPRLQEEEKKGAKRYDSV